MNSLLNMPSQQEIQTAIETSRELASHLQADKVRLRLLNGSESTAQDLPLPASAVRMLLDILEQIAAGNTMTLVPLHAELTTLQASELLNVSRPFLIKLLEQGDIPYSKVGTHRRILAQDVLTYKQEKMSKRRDAIDQMTALSQKLNL